MKISRTLGSFFKHARSCTLEPSRDWTVLLTLSVIALAGIIVWNVWTFETIAQGGVIGSVATSSPPVFDRASLENIRTIFENRAAEKAKYETGAYRFVDPSQ